MKNMKTKVIFIISLRCLYKGKVKTILFLYSISSPEHNFLGISSASAEGFGDSWLIDFGVGQKSTFSRTLMTKYWSVKLLLLLTTPK